MEPLLKETFKAITVETIEDWGKFGYYVSVSFNVDVHMYVIAYM